jgi:hypothetical protein
MSKINEPEVSGELINLYQSGFSIDFSYKAINEMLHGGYIYGVPFPDEKITRAEVRNFLHTKPDALDKHMRKLSQEYVKQRNIVNRKTKNQSYTKNREKGLLYRVTNNNEYKDFNRSP